MPRILALAAVFALGCSDVSSYEGEYEGGVVGTDDSACSDGSCSFIRRGFPAGTTLTLVFDPDPVDGARHITTSDGAFDTTPLEEIEPLAHDQLSLYDFPGGARVRNLIYVTKQTHGPLRGREPMVFVSLMENDDVEVRVLAGAGDYFGVFPLSKK